MSLRDPVTVPHDVSIQLAVHHLFIVLNIPQVTLLVSSETFKFSLVIENLVRECVCTGVVEEGGKTAYCC